MIRAILYVGFLILFFACQPIATVPEIPDSGAFGAMDLMTQMRAYPNKDIPAAGYYQAYREAQESLKDRAAQRSATEPWEGIGPHNIGGRALCVSINPQNNKTIYLGSASGGLWRSYNQGLGVSWEQVATGYPILGVSSIEFAPGDSSVMYIGTGEVYNVEDAGNGAAYRPTRGTYGMGILKSTDGGATWAPSLDWTYQQQRGVWQVKVSPADANIVYAGTTHGTYKSTDAGSNWTQVDATVMVMDMVVHPSNPDIVYIGCGNLSSTGRGIYRTMDGGVNWTKASLGAVPTSFGGKIMLDISETDPNILYASIGNSTSSANGASWLCKSVDGGDNWNVVNTEDYSKWQGWFSHDVDIHPNDPETIMVIGIDIWKSTNGGTSLNKQTVGGVAFGQPPIGEPDGNPNFSHSDHHDVLYDKSDPNTIYFANDGGLYGSFDGGVNFQSLNGGLQTAQFYNGVSVAQSVSNHFVGGLQDNSTVIYEGDLAWTRVIGGDGSWTAWNPIDEDNLFGSSQYLNIAKTVDGGDNWFGASPPNVGPSQNVAFIAPYVLAPSNPSRMYAGKEILYVSNNNGDSWSETNSSNPLNGDPIFAMEVAPSDHNVIYAATAPFNQNAAFFYSNTGGVIFDERSAGLPDRFINDVTVDPNDPEVVYVTMGGFGSGHIYKSENAGNSWKDITRDLPDVPTSAIVVDPAYSEHLYLGNDLGIYFSPDGGFTWEDYNEGIIEGALVMDLKIHDVDRLLYVGTHGKGAYFRELQPLDVATEDLADKINQVNIFPNPVQDDLQVEIESKESMTVSVELININGQLVRQLTTAQNILAGKNKLSYNGLGDLAPGNYLINIKSNTGQLTEQIVKVK